MGHRAELHTAFWCCSRCGSRLISVDETCGYGYEVIAVRRCAECEFGETVLLSSLQAAVLDRQEARRLGDTSRIADRMRDSERAPHAADERFVR